MFLRRAGSIVHALLAAATCVVLPLCAGEPAPKAEGGGPEEKKPRSVDDIIDSIGKGPLDEGVLLQSGTLKVPLEVVTKVESAYVAATKRRQPQYVLTPEVQKALRRSVAFRFLMNALMEKYVTDNKIEIPKEKFEAQFEKFKEAKKAQDGSSYEQFLADQGLTDEEFRRFWYSTWAMQDKLSTTVTAEEVDKLFDQYKDNAPMRRASHILFMFKGAERAPETVTRSKDEAKTAAEEVLKKLKAGEDFAKLAQASSDCPSKAQGGDLSFFPRKGAMAEPFADATYKLEKVGDYTPAPVETAFGFHIIKLTELRPPDELKGEIRRRIAGEKLNKQMQQLMLDAAAVAKFNEKMM
ncbi:MAG: peptidylprolyl isomerase [Planctomycetota bacterium]|nr:peptidylprolyl isomerase [Planctomycetota bacterium]